MMSEEYPWWMTEDQKKYEVWKQTANAHQVWKEIHDWVQWEGVDTIRELFGLMEDRGYEIVTYPGWHVYKDGKCLDDEFRPRI
jgi:hypothetical protein